MITLTLYNSLKKYYVEAQDITRVVDGHDIIGSRSYPWSNVTVYDRQTGEEKTIQVIESARYIGKLMSEDIRNRAENNK